MNEQKRNKSISPSKDTKDYRSGPIDKKNVNKVVFEYTSIQTSKTTREVVPSRSEKNLTDRVRNPMKSVINLNKKDYKKETNFDKNMKKETKTNKKSKDESSSNINRKKKSLAMNKTESLAKEFDSMLKIKNTKQKKPKKVVDKKEVPKKSKEKKIIISNNNSKKFISRLHNNSDYSNESIESPDKGILSTRYDMKNNSTSRGRLSLNPSKKVLKNIKSKTETLSPEKTLDNKNNAAITIQRCFRGYMIRKHIAEAKFIFAVITIQRYCRGFLDRVRTKNLREQMVKKEYLKVDNTFNLSLSLKRNNSEAKDFDLANLLEEILNERNVNESIKNKITDFLRKDGKSSSRSSVQSHIDQEVRSEKRYFEQIEQKKYKFGSPILKCSSPKLEKSDFERSPEFMIENLLSIKEFQREKIISNAKMQIEGLNNLAMKNVFSPRTRDFKKDEIDRKLEEDLQKFDQSMTEVINTCKENEDVVGPIRPFLNNTPERSPSEDEFYGPSPKLSEQSEVDKLNSSEKKNEDLSMELLEYYEHKIQQKVEKQSDRVDPSYQFIEEYLLSMFEYLRQKGQQYREAFIKIMRKSKNIDIHLFLRNLYLLTEDSDDDISFKLPMYKYLEKDETEILLSEDVDEFNSTYQKLQRNQGRECHFETIYLKMIIDAINEALNLERPNTYIFTETSLMGSSNRLKIIELEALDGLGSDDNEPEFSFHFANAMNHIYKWAHYLCAKTISEDDDPTAIQIFNENSMKQYLDNEAKKPTNYYDEILEVVVALSAEIMEQVLIEEALIWNKIVVCRNSEYEF